MTSCAASGRLSLPDSTRTEPTPYPAIPDGDVPCPDNPARRCLSDSQNGSLLRAYDAALTAANEKLHWLADFFAASTK
ncbi:hypothetical protein LWE61_14925 [Sphingobium sufflavum]|uniref:hypothetical protein n=1 Tax=Sphingobium sufflavum TaxID=1129547 RepID=UPI001F363CF9|nr:hypothetical protein [Sphingobium sufflavum]MCE7797843.1 hypothetical protein [Sphingobium sufflavum]